MTRSSSCVIGRTTTKACPALLSASEQEAHGLSSVCTLLLIMSLPSLWSCYRFLCCLVAASLKTINILLLIYFPNCLFFFCIFQNGTGNACCVHGFTGSLLWFCPSSRWLLCGQSAPSLARLLSYLSLQSSYSWQKKHTIIFILRSVFHILRKYISVHAETLTVVSFPMFLLVRMKVVVSHCAIIQTSKTDVHQFYPDYKY